MIRIDWIPLLLAASRRSKFGSSSYRADDAPDIAGFFIMLGVLVALGAIAALLVAVSHRLKNRPVNSPNKLFRELCQAHELSRSDRRLMTRIAEWWELDDPIQLFFERERLRSPSMHESLDCETSARQLEQRLFAK